ncbi:MAG TPA: molybdopterin cofactor-binding domain-containing protein [Thermodesulfobacteriota bacterium]|nr:molybdopterin cofactor-binding domain-containing protein [Thermodesulfobacteriota bacterium]
MTFLGRRNFMKLAGGGLFVFIASGDSEAQRRRSFSGTQAADFNAFLRIGADGRVSCFTGKIEMGQGIITSLAQMLAEELDVPFDSVDMVMGDTDLCPWDAGTFGSRTTKYFGPVLREAAAEARAELLRLAAAALRLPAGRLKTSQGFVADREEPGRKISYADLVQGKRIEKTISGEAPLKSVSGFSVSGKPKLKTD